MALNLYPSWSEHLPTPSGVVESHHLENQLNKLGVPFSYAAWFWINPDGVVSFKSIFSPSYVSFHSLVNACADRKMGKTMVFKLRVATLLTRHPVLFKHVLTCAWEELGINPPPWGPFSKSQHSPLEGRQDAQGESQGGGGGRLSNRIFQHPGDLPLNQTITLRTIDFFLCFCVYLNNISFITNYTQ